MFLIGFLDRGGIGQWAYSLACDISAEDAVFMRFTMEDVNFKNRTINGEIWEDGMWKSKTAPFPLAIRNFERYNKNDTILDVVPYSLGYIIKKEDQLEYLTRLPHISKYIPKTFHLDQECSIIDQIKKWKYGLLKPSYGRLGQGIIFISFNGKKFEVNDNSKVEIYTEKQFQEYVKQFYNSDSREYMLQQFAAGTNHCGRYYNVRVVITKSGDGDWHASSALMSLLARDGSIIANRDVGSRNIDLDALLEQKFKEKKKQIYKNLFEAAILITEALDDLSAQSAEELALDMAIDDAGYIWLHEANWRGGIWLFDDEVGIYRHGGKNLKRIAMQSRSGSSIDRAKGIEILCEKRKDIQEYTSINLNCTFDDGVIFGVELYRKTDQTISSLAKAFGSFLPVVSVSSKSSLYLAKKDVGNAIRDLKNQVPGFYKPLVVSKGGALVYNLNDKKDYREWLNDLLRLQIIDQNEFNCGYSISRGFLRDTIKQNCKILNMKQLDLFIIEGIEYIFKLEKNWEKKWIEAVIELNQFYKELLLKEWGFSIDAKELFKHNYTDPKILLELIPSKYNVPTFINVNVNHDINTNRLKKIIKDLSCLPLKVVFSLYPLNKGEKNWSEGYDVIPYKLIETFKTYALNGQIVLLPIENQNDVNNILKVIKSNNNNSDFLENKWFYNTKNKKCFLGIYKMEKENKMNVEQVQKRMKALSRMANFDHRQIFRFFVDGRFHKSYNGWVGYEANEAGSIAGLMKAYCYMLDNFDLSQGLKATYLRNVHALIMKNVQTKNPKSTAGDMRFLEAGLHINARYSTLENIEELLEMRKDDGTNIFHTKGYNKTANEFTAEEIFDALQKERKIRFRNWYPALTQDQLDSLNDPGDLDKYYETKHFIQREFAKKVDIIVEEYNEEIDNAKSDDDVLIAIARVTRNLEILHPFPDGNGRAFIAVLMNHLLLYNGFLVSILYDPNIDIELSVKEFAQEIKSGIANTEKLLEDPEYRLYDYSINDSSKDDIKDFEKLAKEFILKLSPYKDLDFKISDNSPSGIKASYVYLSAQRIEESTKGKWINIQNENIQKLRFESIHVDEISSSNQLFFFRHLDTLKTNPVEYIDKLSENGVIAVVVDDITVAKNSPIPALFVEDVDDALAVCARVARREVNCKAVAVVGTSHKKEVKLALESLLNKHAEVNILDGLDNKTPHIMASLSNLRLTDNLEITDIDIGSRPNPISYRSRRVEPNIVLMTNLEFEFIAEANLKNTLEAYSAMIDGLQPGGLYIINSRTQYLDSLIETIRDRKDVAIQTFGMKDSDEAQLISSNYNEKEKAWEIEAKIFGRLDSYVYHSSASKYNPLLFIGMLLVIENLGYDIKTIFDSK